MCSYQERFSLCALGSYCTILWVMISVILKLLELGYCVKDRPTCRKEMICRVAIYGNEDIIMLKHPIPLT